MSATAHAAERAQWSLAFVACPIMRDTTTVPCWLAEYEGELYYLTIQVDSTVDLRAPQLGYEMLVEGTPSDKPRICGGIPLEPVQLSVMPETSPECQTMLPADPRYELGFAPPRPPGPGYRPLIFIPPPPELQPPFVAATFDLPFDFDRGIDSRHAQRFRKIVAYARAIHASRLEITGYRTATRLSNGDVLTEQEGIGELRATQVAELLKGGDLTEPQYEVEWNSRPAEGTPASRIVRVVVVP
jgi:hypothetical protein